MIEQVLNRLREEPAMFVREILNAEPDSWQDEALAALAQNSRIAIRSGHGVGKTALESWAILWFLFTRPFARVVATAPTVRQLYDVLWTELAKWMNQSPLLNNLFEWQKTKIVMRSEPERWFAVARTAVRPENLAGFHEQSILFVLDEASGIDDSIFEAIEGALTTDDSKLLICSNPTRNAGFFKRAFYEEREYYWTMKVSSEQSGRVADEYCQRLIGTYGIESDVVRVRVRGEFPKAEADGLIELEKVEAAMTRTGQFKGELVIGVDVARFGNDQTIICPRVGDDVLELISYRKTDLMTTCGAILNALERTMNRFKMKSAKINVDDDGVGGGVTDRLREVIAERSMPVSVKDCHNGGRPRDSHYANFVTECYFTLRDRFQNHAITLPHDDLLAVELTTRKYSLNSRDQLILEPKEAFKKRLSRSPDRADALALAFAPTLSVAAPPQAFLAQSYWR